MRTYLVVMDETQEAEVALHYAARRAAATGGTVEILAIIPPQEVVEWGAVQEAMAEEARLRAEARVVAASGEMMEESGIRPSITVRQGTPVRALTDFLKERQDISVLVLAAASDGAPGPLVAHFGGAAAGGLPCPLVIVPAALTGEALDRVTA